MKLITHADYITLFRISITFYFNIYSYFAFHDILLK